MQKEQLELKESSVEQLGEWFERYVVEFKIASREKKQIEDQMRRKGVKRLAPEKIARLVRRLTSNKSKIQEIEMTLDVIKQRLSGTGVVPTILSNNDDGSTPHLPISSNS